MNYLFSSSSKNIDGAEDLVVAIIYPIQDITPNNPPTIIRTESCCTIGLHSDNMSKYAKMKKPVMQRMNIMTPTARRLYIELQFFVELFI